MGGKKTGNDAASVESTVDSAASLLVIMKELREIKTGMEVARQENEKEFLEIKTFQKSISTDLGEISANMYKLSEKISCNEFEINNLKNQVVTAEEKNQEIQEKITQLEQHTRKNNLEITNVPEKKSENVLALLHTISQKIGLTLEKYDIDAVHRVARMTNAVGENRPRSIIVRFVSRQKRDEFKTACKVRRLSSDHLGLGGNEPIFVNDHLCPSQKKLFSDARKLKNELGMKYCWTRNGNVYLRRKDGAKVIHVTSHDQLLNIRNGIC